MVRRSALILFELLGALIAGAAIAVGVLAWRLSTGPIALEFLTPYIEDALSAGPDQPAVKIARTAVTWQGWRSNPELTAEAVRVVAPDGRVLATVPALALSISLDRLLRGKIAPSRIEVVQPRLQLVRTEDGAITVDIGEGHDGDLAGRSMTDLAAPMGGEGPLGQVRRISVRDADVTIDDRMLGRSWRLPDGDFVFNRNQDGLDGTLSVAVDLGAAPIRLDGRFEHSRVTGLTEVTARFNLPEPSQLAGLHPQLAPLADLALPIRGEAKVAFVLPSTIESASLEIQAGAGRIAHPSLAGGQIQITGAVGHVRWEPAARRVSLDDLWVDLGGPRFTFAGTVDGLGGPMRIALETSFHDVPTEVLWRLWPPPVAPGGRRWTTANVSDGGVREAQAKLTATLESPDAPIQVERLEGVFSFQGLTANYMTGLPPVRQIAGTARFDEQQMVLETTSGSLLRATRVPRATIRITDFQRKDQQIAIDVRTSGPIGEALEVLDRPRLGFMTRFGIKPTEVGGDADIDLSFAFPAIDAIRIEDVRIRGRAEARNVSAPVGIDGWRLTEADLAVTVDKDALGVSGRGRLHGAPVAVTWRETFAPRGGVQSQYTLKGRLDDAARKRFGYDTAPWITGATDVDIALTQRADRRSELTIRADLTPATMAVAPVGWRKAAGVRASASFAVDFAGPRMTAIRAIRVTAPGLAAEGTLATGGDAWTLDLTSFAIGETSLAARIRPRGTGYAITVGGPQLDARPLFDGPVGKTPAPAQGVDPRLAIEARFDKVMLDAGRTLERVTATIERDQGTTRNLRLDAMVPGGGTVQMAIAPSGPGTRRLTAKASDAGVILAAFGGLDNIRGGTIDLQGTIADRNGKDTITGNVVVRNYRQIRAPMLAQMFSILSLPTMTSLLQGEGIPFAEASTDFTWIDGKVTLRNARAYGGALGFTAEGTIDVRAETLDLEGTLVPAYTINNLLGNIPILGTILAGGKDEGVFAANYRIAGPFADPRISVNVLSALAPGILRKMFGFLEAGDPMRSPSAQPGFRQDGLRPGN
ncbi:MAG: AsmA-like C-terminal domain-containing protein [Alphaproteobacteria bacterium]